MYNFVWKKTPFFSLSLSLPADPLAKALVPDPPSDSHGLDCASNSDGLSYKEIEDYFTILAACHTILVTQKEQKEGVLANSSAADLNSLSLSDTSQPFMLQYQGSSPDEVALVEAAARLGAVFERRTANAVGVYYGIREAESDPRTILNVLTVLEFSSDRKRMSVILRLPDGSVQLLCKGADSVIMSRLAINQSKKSSDPELDIDMEEEQRALDATVQQLESYSLKVTRERARINSRGHCGCVYIYVCACLYIYLLLRRASALSFLPSVESLMTSGPSGSGSTSRRRL